MTPAQTLVESDRVYFELAADLEPIPGGWLATMDGLHTMAAGCVVHRVEPESVTSDGWVEYLQSRFAELGAPRVRFYLKAADAELECFLSNKGFRKRTELGFLYAQGAAKPPGDVALRPVVAESDWIDKTKIHASWAKGPDGYPASSTQWVEMEKRKCATGNMKAYLVEVAGEPAGAVAEIEMNGLVRAKNLLVAPAWRRQGIASAALHLLWLGAARRGKPLLGLFGIQSTLGQSLYSSLGMQPVTVWTEWSKDLGPAEQPNGRRKT